MAKTRKQAEALVEEQAAVEQVETQVAEATSGNELFQTILDEFMANAVVAEKSQDDVIRELLASGKAKRLNNLNVKNVVATQFETHTLLTFMIAEYVIGDVRDRSHTDAFGDPIIGLGKTHAVQTSSFSVASVMKQSPKLAIFAGELVDTPDIATALFAGSKMDVVMQFVKAGEEYANPFANNATPVTFDRDKVIHHVVRLELGEVGQDMYRARLAR